MSLPTERISLSCVENRAVRVGLDRILNGFAEITAGVRWAPEIFDYRVRNKFMPRTLDEDCYGLILELRNRLALVMGRNSSSHSLTCIQWALAAFAVRVGRDTLAADGTSELERKIENCRKRAKRKTVSRLGSAEYESAQTRWGMSLRWIRYYVLPMRTSRGPALKLAMRREQYQEMFRLAEEVLSERCVETPAKELVAKFVTLAIAEIRRFRHPGIKVKELIRNPANGKDFLYEFIKKRMDKRGTELKLKFEYLPRCVQAAIKTEKFKTAMVIDDSPAEPAVRSPTVRLAAPEPMVAPHGPTLPTEPAPAELPSLPRTVTHQDVTDWLVTHVERGYWDDIIAEAKHQLGSQAFAGKQSFTSTNLAGIQEETRPVADPADAPECINAMVDWLLSWTLALEKDTVRLRNLLSEGLRTAAGTHKPLDNSPRRINGVRYIQGITDGTLRS